MNDKFDFLRAGHRHIADSTNLKQTISGLVKMAAATSGTDMGSLFLLHKYDRALHPYILLNLPDSYLAGCATVPVGTQCCGRAVLHKIPWVVEDMWSDPLFEDCRNAARNSGIRAAFSVPVITDTGECVGSLASHFREVHRPGQDTLETIQMMGSLIAYALTKSTQMLVATEI
jgi:GAF domain-containing protein